VNREQQLEWEARWGRPAAAAAVGAALFLVASFAYGVSALGSGNVRGDRAQQLRIDENATDLVIIAGLNGLAVLCMGGVLVYLFYATKARRPELHQAALVLAIAAVTGVPAAAASRSTSATSAPDAGRATASGSMRSQATPST